MGPQRAPEEERGEGDDRGDQSDDVGAAQVPVAGRRELERACMRIWEQQAVRERVS
jgi:hypothetical protein